jgi:hypothetical protein
MIQTLHAGTKLGNKGNSIITGTLGLRILYDEARRDPPIGLDSWEILLAQRPRRYKCFDTVQLVYTRRKVDLVIILAAGITHTGARHANIKIQGLRYRPEQVIANSHDTSTEISIHI